MRSGFVFVYLLCAAALAAQSSFPPAAQAEIEELEAVTRAQRRLLNDWGGVTRYGSENAELKWKPNPNRIVFLGDDITENWGESFFPGKPYLNRGIAHQTTAQMLVRFRQDVIALQPKAVIIQGGLNDLAGYGGPQTEGTIADYIQSMADLAKAHGIRVILASATPVCDCTRTLTDRRPPGKIIGLNGWMKQYAAAQGLVYLDYYSALVQGRTFNRELTADGLVPNAAGYAKMAPLAEAAIAAALAK